MKKSYLFFLASFLFLVSCNKNTTKIEGSFSDNTNDGKLVYLQTIDVRAMNSSQGLVLDSATVKDGKFQLKTELKESPVIGMVSIGKMKDLRPNDNPVMASLVLEPGTVRLSFDKTTYTLDGTPKNKDINKVVAVMNKANVLQEEARLAGSLEAVPLDEKGQNFMTRMQTLVKEMQDETFTFTKANMNNKVGEFMLMTSGDSFSEEQLKELLTLADSSFLKLPAIAELQEFLNGGNDNYDIKTPTFENIQLADVNGQTVNLSDYIGKGKYVLVDFWATWCGPCMQEIPNLKKAYNTYKPKGFEIVGISLDRDPGAWKRVINDRGLNWIHLYDVKQEAATFYNVVSIPHTLLFDKEGNLIDMRLRGQGLEKKLEELLK